MKCLHCGYDMPESANFCKQCGYPAEWKPSEDETRLDPINSLQTGSGEQPPVLTGKQKTKKILIPLIIIGVIAVLLVAYLATDHFHGNSRNQAHVEAVTVDITTEDIIVDGTYPVTLHYERVAIDPSYKHAEKINQVIEEDIQAFSTATGRHEPMSLWLFDASMDEPMSEDFFPGTVTTEITHNGNGILSILFTAHYIYDYECHYGFTFDLTTGELLDAGDCFPDVPRQELTDTVSRLIDEATEEYIYCDPTDYSMDNPDYYVSKGELTIISPPFQYPDGTRCTYTLPTGIFLGGYSPEDDSSVEDTDEQPLFSYLGMTVGDIKARWGDDIIYADFWYGSSILYFWYDDTILPACAFGIDDLTLKGYGADNDVVNCISYFPSSTDIVFPITEGLRTDMTLMDLENSGFDISTETSSDPSEGEGTYCWCTLHTPDNYIIDYIWYWVDVESYDAYAPDPYAVVSDEINIIAPFFDFGS